jgi:hypothetical protein
VYVAGGVASLAGRHGDRRCGRDGYAAAHGKRDGKGARSYIHGDADGDGDKETTAHRDRDCYGDADADRRTVGNGDPDPNAYPRAHL